MKTTEKVKKEVDYIEDSYFSARYISYEGKSLWNIV